VAELVAQLAQTAVARDQSGGHAASEREAIRRSGLLSLSIPEQYGGQGAGWSEVLGIVRCLAEVDSALAHVFGFHHLQLAGVLLHGGVAQHERFLIPTARDGLFWGNALNPLDQRVIGEQEDDGYRIYGVKSFSSGSVGSDFLTVSAWHRSSGTALSAAVPTARAGVTVNPDWDAFGQRQTDSGTVRFDNVRIEADDVLQRPGGVATPRATLRSQIAQLVMTNLYLGIAQGALSQARHYLQTEAKPWFDAGVSEAAEDPYVQEQFGEFSLKIRAAQVLADLAGAALDAALEQGDALTAQQRGELAVSGAQAKVLSHRAALDVASAIFEITGARSTAARFGFDRFWRNARVHTLHDPVIYKVRDLGRHAIDGRLPDPTAYS
jgi:alkylation response protein AidB-like acyl-CoA dehydrogenase